MKLRSDLPCLESPSTSFHLSYSSFYSLLPALLMLMLDGVSHNLSASIFPTQARHKLLSQTQVGLINALASLTDILASLFAILNATPSNQALEKKQKCIFLPLKIYT